jgi:tetratricopeptide (TPR) repeat protein
MKMTAYSAAAAALVVLCAWGAGAQEALPPAVGQPLQKAKAFLQAHRYPQAMQQVNIASSRATTDSQRFVVEEMRGSIAEQSGDTATAARVFQDMIYSGKIFGAQKQRLIQAEVGIAYQEKNYKNAVAWLVKYFAAGGNSPEMNDLRIGAYYQAGDYATAAKLQSAQIAAEQKARQVPKEAQLQLLAACQDKLKDNAGFENTMINLVFYYPKPDYWANLVHNVEVTPGFSDRLTLDLDRVKLALGTITSGKDYMEMTELALQGPLPGEAKSIIDKGFATGAVGTGAQAERDQRLRSLVNKTYDSQLKDMPKREADAESAHDGNALVSLGEEYASYGNYAKGIPLIEQGIAKDQLRHPEDTKLHLGIAYMNSGNKAKALQLFRTVGGKDGTAGIARLWILWLTAKKA